MVLEQVPCREVKIVMADMNTKVMMDNTGRDEVMCKHGVRAEIRKSCCVLVPKASMVCRLQGGPIEKVNEFTYLGSFVSKKGGTDEDIQTRSGKARQACSMLRPIW